MRVSGFTILRNGVEFDFPFRESILSALPICDEFIVNVGVSTDGTRQALEDFARALPSAGASKVKLFESAWPLDDPEKRKGGAILSEQTNLALERCRGDWCLYLQADEVLHEEDLPLLRRQFEELDEPEALVFRYVHFYGTYDVIQTSRSSYRREVRAIRNGRGIRSAGDAQGFRRGDGSKVEAVLTSARIFHYGWVRHQEIMRAKTGFMDTLYHPGASPDRPVTGDNYLYKRIVGLRPFRGTHPAVMRERVQNTPSFDFSKAPGVFHWKDTWKLLSGWIERLTGHRLFEYRNYRLMKKKR
ncbi:MAG: glycosyltransferase [Deltaproteobacteria bacterium]|nr:glycosyltransferase [Deltaproteobacteria bacterium]